MSRNGPKTVRPKRLKTQLKWMKKELEFVLTAD
jgi:hypothetical protein